MQERETSTPGGIDALSDRTFLALAAFLRKRIGFHLPMSKKPLVASRLGRRVRALGLEGFDAYLDRIQHDRDPEETQQAVDLVTTNETWFFREPDHFTFLRETILASHRGGSSFGIWCAAAATGEEPWSLAMILAETLPDRTWSLVASDISVQALETARAATYPFEDASSIPEPLRRKYCLRGTGAKTGLFRIGRELRDRVEFRRINLLSIPPALRDLDAVFLRNALIYFDRPTRTRILQEVSSRLKPDGWLVLGHAESVVGLDLPLLRQWKPSICRRISEPAKGRR
ncbi:MAG: protein-glutamate O-methyltransferase CheR [Fibrobacteria bacterium]|nr:protein-glutamate O-methyltransferase CheR [Fibrobacteria bacterium]